MRRDYNNIFILKFGDAKFEMFKIWQFSTTENFRCFVNYDFVMKSFFFFFFFLFYTAWCWPGYTQSAPPKQKFNFQKKKKKKKKKRDAKKLLLRVIRWNTVNTVSCWWSEMLFLCVPSYWLGVSANIFEQLFLFFRFFLFLFFFFEKGIFFFFFFFF